MSNIKIVIPTLNRVNKQISFRNLPDKYKQKVYFIVREHEEKQMKEKYLNPTFEVKAANVIVLPKNIPTGLPATKIFILEYFKNDKIYMIDDDLTFSRKLPNTEKIPNKKGIITKWRTIKMVEHDFDELFNEMENYMKDGYVHGAINISSTPPSGRYWPRNYNGKIGGNVFLDIPNLPKDVEYYRYCKTAEDYETNLQLLKKGFKNIIFTDFTASEKTGAPGGCATYRTLDMHNKSQLELHERHPDVVKIREKKTKDDKIRLDLTIYWKKAYNPLLCEECDEIKDGDYCDCNE